MTATERLRKLLDERGVEWESENCPSFDGKVVYRYTYWGEGNCTTFCEPIGAQPGTLGAECDFSIIGFTPEQAIAATLGDNGAARSNNGVTAEQVREAIEENSWKEAFMLREFNESSWQAIADELNALSLNNQSMSETLSERGTCRNVDDDPGWFECSECRCTCSVDWWGDGLGTPKFCPACGRKVVNE